MENDHPKSGRWLRDYVFWRDILTTMIGGLLVLITAYLWAIFTGYIQSPGVWETVVSLAAGFAAPIITLVAALLGMIFAWRATKQAKAGEDWFSQSLTESFRSKPRSETKEQEPDDPGAQDS